MEERYLARSLVVDKQARRPEGLVISCCADAEDKCLLAQRAFTAVRGGRRLCVHAVCPLTCACAWVSSMCIWCSAHVKQSWAD